ncbi:hypothetical protein [uncultured Sphingomonas sp.]|uniref:hypothetical protein n=1 Tax=uncultured Sphingomonas sp. TaxID=158754 RepID=UPI0025FECB37|nr:hypothetical protein [uncultured Sphingomonas sp.]
MNNFAPSDRPPTRGPRKGAIVALVLIAFVAGILLMAYAMRNLSWFDTNGTATQAVTAKPGGTVKEAPRTDPMALATREAQLAAQLAALETRAATLSTDATAAGAQAGRAESILVAAAARRAVDRGQPLGYLEEQLRTRFGTSEPRAVTVLVVAARQPVTLEMLRQGLDTLAPDLVVSGGNGWWEGLRQELARLIVIREANAPSTNPADRLARARRLLDGGQVDAARVEVARLPGAAAAQAWQQAALRYVRARQALDLIENAALVTPPAPPPAPIVTTPVPGTPPADTADTTTAQTNPQDSPQASPQAAPATPTI